MFPVAKCCIPKSRVTSLLPINLRIIRYNQTDSNNAAINSNEFRKAEHYDIIIAGGGLVGTTLACSLGKNKILSNKKVLLLEGAPKFKGFLGGEYGNRVSALNVNTIKLMKTIGAWDTIAAARYKPVKQMQVWDASSDARITFEQEKFSDGIAYIIENDLVLHAVYKELENLNNVEVKNLSKIECVKLPKDGVPNSQVTLKDGETYSCDLLIGADGANSLVRKQMAVEPFAVNYNQMGLVATLDLEDAGENSTAWQRFLPTGPVALLPLSETMSSLVWSTTPQHAKELISMSPEDFVNELNGAFCKEYPRDDFVQAALGAVNRLCGAGHGIRQYPPAVKNVKDKSRACFPLGFSHSPSYIVQGAALIGDAAHRVHPLAGQGVNLGFGDVKCLTKVLAEAVYAGYLINEKSFLLKYERERLAKNVPIMVGIHGLQKLYDTTFSPVVMMRSLGLQITQNIPPLKKIFMKQAMG